eukprot:CAMPEP_0115125572 /NCGR_PEP_ID=MMETSP0227-20121206/49126_1 /TAXON_ID=89957 /ORGANISM="Polarella glacialis, Strain CCMP 1383" /LENGTH=77 /DNA_ID=CAMNT_0002528977 /DNA_START=23 /DNA_END=252 /DNA_ORIENTATION=+
MDRRVRQLTEEKAVLERAVAALKADREMREAQYNKELDITCKGFARQFKEQSEAMEKLDKREDIAVKREDAIFQAKA